MISQPPFVITLDTDWAPDFVMDSVAETLIREKVRATWFVTHQSPSIERLRAHRDLFELGIHPNFSKGSTQGTTAENVLKYCMDVVPNALSMRTHGLVQSTEIFEKVLEHTKIQTDVSLYLPRIQRPEPVYHWWNGKCLLRMPYAWEDDLEMEQPEPCWKPQLLSRPSGLVPVVLDFHPVHIYLNSLNMNAYRSIKARVSDISKASRESFAPYIHSGDGTGRMFSALVQELSGNGQSLRICDVANKYRLEPRRKKAL